MDILNQSHQHCKTIGMGFTNPIWLPEVLLDIVIQMFDTNVSLVILVKHGSYFRI